MLRRLKWPSDQFMFKNLKPNECDMLAFTVVTSYFYQSLWFLWHTYSDPFADKPTDNTHIKLLLKKLIENYNSLSARERYIYKRHPLWNIEYIKNKVMDV